MLIDPSESLAVAVSVIVAGAVNVVPFADRVTVGGVFGFGFTVIETAVEVVVAPALSVATAVMVYVPAATLFQVKL